MKRMLWLLLALALAACSAKKSDPPPPASSAIVPQAAPNARGTMAAGSAPVPGLATPTDPDQEEPEEIPAPGVPPPRFNPEPVDSGVTL